MASHALPKLLRDPQNWIPLAAVGAIVVAGAAGYGVVRMVKSRRQAKLLPRIDVGAYNSFPVAA